MTKLSAIDSTLLQVGVFLINSGWGGVPTPRSGTLTYNQMVVRWLADATPTSSTVVS
jgi:hypothetical protein